MSEENRKKLRSVESEAVALRLVAAMVDYEKRLDEKKEKTEAEERHVAFLRAMREAGLLPVFN